MNEKLQAIMLGLLTQYISMMTHVMQKQVLSSRNPQPWMIDKGFNNLFNNVPQHFHNATQPAPQQFDMSSLFSMFANGAPQQGVQPPVQPPVSTQTTTTP